MKLRKQTRFPPRQHSARAIATALELFAPIPERMKRGKIARNAKPIDEQPELPGQKPVAPAEKMR